MLGPGRALPLLILLAAACSAPKPSRPAAPAVEPPPAGELPPGPAILRHNPPRCPCSPWEVRFPDHWERVHVEDKSRDGDLLQALVGRAEEDDRADRDGTYEVLGELLDVPRGDRAGHVHRVLRVTGLPEPPEEEEPPEEAPEEGEPTEEAPPGPPPPPPAPASP